MAFYGLTSFVYQLTLWIARLVYVNVLWIVFSLLGLLVAGVFPATAATFSLIRLWLQDRSVPIARHFYQEYKKSFGKANKLGWPIVPILLTVIIGLRWSVVSDSSWSGLATLLAAICLTLIIFYCVFLFPVFTHYDVSVKEKYKYTFFIAVAYPHYAFGMIVVWVILAYTLLITGFLIFFFASFTALIMMYGALKAFDSIENKQMASGRQEEQRL